MRVTSAAAATVITLAVTIATLALRVTSAAAATVITLAVTIATLALRVTSAAAATVTLARELQGFLLDKGHGIAVGMMADVDREHDAILGRALDGDGGHEAGTVSREDGHKAVVGAAMVRDAGVVVGADGRGGLDLGAGEAATEGGHVGAMLRRPR